MKSRLVGKLAIWLVAGAVVSLAMAACGETSDCKNLRDSTYASKRSWDACDPSDLDSCIKVPGNKKDCTGVLSCDFAVNRRYRDLAEQAVYKIGEQSQGCFLCATPNCLTGEIPYCEPVSQRCVIVTEILDSGAIQQGGDVDASAPVPDASPVVDTGTTPIDSGND